MTRPTRHHRGSHTPRCLRCPRVRQLGAEFQTWRAAWEARLEAESNGYVTEAAAFRAAHPAPTFRRYLVAMTGSGWPMSGRAA